jgi:sulfatase maturation enzyme AslB (radical SAM superfamily)
MTNTYCPIPWIFQAVRNNGDVRVCCQANITKNQGVIRHPDGTSFNAGRDDMDVARNAPLMNEIRTNMLNGVWSEECARCKTEEESGLTSRRNYENERWGGVFNEEWARTVTSATDGKIDTPVRYLDLRFGNLCNLACRMCGPTDSHTWYKDHVAMHGPQYNDTHGTVTLEQNAKGRWGTSDYDWHHSEQFWEYLEQNLHTLDHVYMAGGEPLMIERHYDFLQKCIDSDDASHIILEYNTNITNIPERVLSLWTHFQEVRIGASVDGFGKVLEYQRYPAKWNSLEKNLLKIDQLPSNVAAWLSVTVTPINVFHIPEFMLWKLEQGYRKINASTRKPIITHHVAHRPYHMNIQVLPEKLKQQVLDEYQAAKLKFPPELQGAASTVLDGISTYMCANNLHDTHWDVFVERTTQLDKLRNQSIVNAVPVYGDFFK